MSRKCSAAFGKAGAGYLCAVQVPAFFAAAGRVLRNFYLLTGAAFVGWMVVFDANDVGKQLDIYRKWRELRNEKDYYQANIDVVRKERAELMSSPALLEKFAREKYLMKRPGEDLFVLVPEEEK